MLYGCASLLGKGVQLLLHSGWGSLPAPASPPSWSAFWVCSVPILWLRLHLVQFIWIGTMQIYIAMFCWFSQAHEADVLHRQIIVSAHVQLPSLFGLLGMSIKNRVQSWSKNKYFISYWHWCQKVWKFLDGYSSNNPTFISVRRSSHIVPSVFSPVFQAFLHISLGCVMLIGDYYFLLLAVKSQEAINITYNHFS